MERLINHISQFCLDSREAGNYDNLSQISVGMACVFAVLRFVRLLRQNGWRYGVGLPCRLFQPTTDLNGKLNYTAGYAPVLIYNCYKFTIKRKIIAFLFGNYNYSVYICRVIKTHQYEKR